MAGFGGRNLPIFVCAVTVVAVSIAVVLIPDANLPRFFRREWSADVIVSDAVIFTVDDAMPFADAMAVRGGRIIRVGTYADVKHLRAHGTYELNLSGNVVLPGFIDSHVHLIPAGLLMGQVDLGGVSSREEFVSKVKEAVGSNNSGEWIFGRGWNNDAWGGELPDASWIDDVTPDNPVWLTRMDGHMAVGNSVTLRKTGISRGTSNPDGGSIMRTFDGEPTGLLIDSAMNLVLSVIPETTINERRSALEIASKHALMRGVTTVVDFGSYFPGMPVDRVRQDLSEVYRWADSTGKMAIRACLFFPMPARSQLLEIIEKEGRSLSQRLYLGGVKAFADGSLGSSTALFHEPYEHDKCNFGLQLTDMDWLLNATLESDKSGLQVAIHAIGDKANEIVLNMFNSVSTSNGPRDRRYRIEHAQHLVPGAAAGFGKLNVIASVQPDHLLDDAISVEKKIGANRAHQGSYLFRSLLAGGAMLAFGSDWPVVDTNPLRAIRTAISRKPPGWENAWIPRERIDLEDALKSQTISAAYACFLDHVVGSLSPGKYADFVVLPSKSWGEFVNDLPTDVLATYVGGERVYPEH